MSDTNELNSNLEPEMEAGANQTSIMSVAIHAAQAARSLIGLKLLSKDLVPGQDRLLLMLEKNGRMTVGAAADGLNVRASTVSKMIDRLTERGMTVRIRVPHDLRKAYVELTDKGRVICVEVRAIHKACESELRSTLGTSAADRISASVHSLNEALTKQLRRHR